MTPAARLLRLVCSALVFGASLAMLLMGAPASPVVGMAFGVYLFSDVLRP